MKLSVVIPYYSHAEYIGKSIESIMNQSYNCYELIIILNVCSEGLIVFHFSNKKHPHAVICLRNRDSDGFFTSPPSFPLSGISEKSKSFKSENYDIISSLLYIR